MQLNPNQLHSFTILTGRQLALLNYYSAQQLKKTSQNVSKSQYVEDKNTFKDLNRNVNQFISPKLIHQYFVYHDLDNTRLPRPKDVKKDALHHIKHYHDLSTAIKASNHQSIHSALHPEDQRQLQVSFRHANDAILHVNKVGFTNPKSSLNLYHAYTYHINMPKRTHDNVRLREFIKDNNNLKPQTHQEQERQHFINSYQHDMHHRINHYQKQLKQAQKDNNYGLENIDVRAINNLKTDIKRNQKYYGLNKRPNIKHIYRSQMQINKDYGKKILKYFDARSKSQYYPQPQVPFVKAHYIPSEGHINPRESNRIKQHNQTSVEHNYTNYITVPEADKKSKPTMTEQRLKNDEQQIKQEDNKVDYDLNKGNVNGMLKDLLHNKSMYMNRASQREPQIKDEVKDGEINSHQASNDRKTYLSNGVKNVMRAKGIKTGNDFKKYRNHVAQSIKGIHAKKHTYTKRKINKDKLNRERRARRDGIQID